MPQMTIRESKRRLAQILEEPSLDGRMAAIGVLPRDKAISGLLPLLCHTDPPVKWRAVQCLGRVVAGLAAENREAARIHVRRLLWTLTEESGGIGWGAPEGLGEMLSQDAGLCSEFRNMVVSLIWEKGNFLEFEPLQQGAVWAVGRIAEAFPNEREKCFVRGLLPFFLGSPHPLVRGMAAWTAGLVGNRETVPLLQPLTAEDHELMLLQAGEITRTTVGELAEKSRALLAEGPE
jgi:hypothetical protein